MLENDSATVVELVNLVLNGGGTAVMLFLYLRLEQRYDTLQTRTLAILERLADIQEEAQGLR